jgi:putative endonuclease
MTNDTNTVTYIGVTNDLVRRVKQHKNKLTKGFTSTYNINKLVYFEAGEDVDSAITREKQIKTWSRRKKVELISSLNPDWRDLYQDIIEG